MTDPTEDNTVPPQIVLESPPELGSPVSELSQAIIGDETFGSMAAKLKMVESLLRLSTRDLRFNELMREVLLVVMHTIKCEAGSIFEVNQESGTLFFRAATGRSSDQLSNFELPLGQGIVGHVAESRQPMLINDIQNNPIHSRAISQAVDFEVHNLVAVPILIRTKTYGVLEVLNRVGERNFNNNDLELLEYAAEMISKIVEIRMMINWARKSGKGSGAAA